MLPVEGDNPASARVIKRNGGRLARRVEDPETYTLTHVYWIKMVETWHPA